MSSVDKQLQAMAVSEFSDLVMEARAALEGVATLYNADVASIAQVLTGVKMQTAEKAMIKHLRERKVKSLLASLQS